MPKHFLYWVFLISYKHYFLHIGTLYVTLMTNLDFLDLPILYLKTQPLKGKLSIVIHFLSSRRSLVLGKCPWPIMVTSFRDFIIITDGSICHRCDLYEAIVSSLRKRRWVSHVGYWIIIWFGVTTWGRKNEVSQLLYCQELGKGQQTVDK